MLSLSSFLSPRPLTVVRYSWSVGFWPLACARPSFSAWECPQSMSHGLHDSLLNEAETGGGTGDTKSLSLPLLHAG